MASHSPLLVTLMVVNLIAYLFVILFSFMSRMNTKPYIGIDFLPTIFSDNYDDNGISPATPTFAIWVVIYIWHAVIICYGFAGTCRRAPDGPVYTNPVLLTPAFYCVMILNWGLSLAWYYVATYAYGWWAFVLLAGMFITTYICLGLSYKAVSEHYDTLVKQERKKEIWLIRIIVQNGIATYATWTTLATQIQLSTTLSFSEYPAFETALSSTIALGIFTVELLVFLVMDWVVLEKHTRYTVAPYFVAIIGLIGITAENWNPQMRNPIFVVVLLGFVCVATVVKFVLVFVRHSRDAKRQEILPTTQTEKPSDVRL